MKKTTVRLLALVLCVLLLCGALTACSSAPNADPNEAVASLKATDYTVELVKGYNGAEYGLFAWKLDPKLDVADEIALAAMEGESVATEYLVVYYFKDAKAAEEAFSAWCKAELELYVEDIRETLSIYRQLGNAYDVKFTCEISEITLSDNMVYVGTTGALSDAS